MVEGELRQLRDRMPGGVVGQLGIGVRRDEPEVRGRDLPLSGVARGVAERFELLEVGDLAHVDLRGEVLPDRLLERLTALEVATRQRPGTEKRLARPPPDESLQRAVPDLQDDCEGGVSRLLAKRLARSRISGHW